MAEEKLELRWPWKFGFRWCEACGCRCQSTFCLDNNACSQVVHGSGGANFALEAESINKTLKVTP